MKTRTAKGPRFFLVFKEFNPYRSFSNLKEIPLSLCRSKDASQVAG